MKIIFNDFWRHNSETPLTLVCLDTNEQTLWLQSFVLKLWFNKIDIYVSRTLHYFIVKIYKNDKVIYLKIIDMIPNYTKNN